MKAERIILFKLLTLNGDLEVLDYQIDHEERLRGVGRVMDKVFRSNTLMNLKEKKRKKEKQFQTLLTGLKEIKDGKD